MLKVGITGGIGSGKSIVAKCFAKLGVSVIDADEVVHNFLDSSNTVSKKIISHFGDEILVNNKKINKKIIDKKKLHKLIFENKKERIWLENLIHPCVRKEIEKRIKNLNSSHRVPYCIIVVPLLFETRHPPKINRVLVVDCPKIMQIKRVCKRNKYSASHVKHIMAAQLNRKERLKRADDVVRNVGTRSQIYKIVKKLHNYYLSLI